MNNDPHNQILDAYFWHFVDRGDAPADTPLFTGISRRRLARSGYRTGIRPSTARSRVRHRDRPEGGRAMNRDIYEAITDAVHRAVEARHRAVAEALVCRPEHRLAQTLPRNQRPASWLDGLPVPILDQFQADARPWRPCEEGREIHAGHLLQDPRKAGRSREDRCCARTASPPAFRSSGGRMFSISTRPKASRRPRSRRARACPSRSKRRLPSWKMPGSARSTTRDSPPSTRPRMT